MVVRRRGSHIFYTVSSHVTLKLSALRTIRALSPGIFLVLNSVSGQDNPRVTVRLEGLGQLQNPITSSGIEPATFRLAA
jgi:hypothetical protein